jgi:hypothetical protein
MIILVLWPPALAVADTLSVEARHDVPGPVDIVAEGWDSQGTALFSSTLTWSLNDNSWGANNLIIPVNTRVIRLTFINDHFVCCDPDDDRNGFIDFIEINGNRREAEDFDRTGGTDQNFPGCDTAVIDGRVTAGCGNNNDFVEYDLFFFKAAHPNFAPSGMPDFDQKQDAWAHEILCGPNLIPDSAPGGDDVPLVAACSAPDEPAISKGPNNIMETLLVGDDIYRYEYCVPTSIASCLWWFDSKFETDPAGTPCDGNDTYPLVTAYPLSGDDHCDINVDDPITPAGGTPPGVNTAFGELIEDLAWRMDTGGQRTGSTRFGTSVADMEAAVLQYLAERGLTDEYIVNLVPLPDFDFVAREIRRSQDVILALSFVQNCGPAPVFLGGHAVTAAGVVPDLTLNEICISDPFLDMAEMGSTGRVIPPPPHGHIGPPETLHNDAQNISHDCYPVIPSGNPFGVFGLQSYSNAV